MLFDSPVFFAYLIPVVLVYWRLSHRGQNIFLLIASYIFYGWWDWRFLGLMIATTTVDFLVAGKVSPAQQGLHRKRWLVLSLVWNFTVLAIFKYLGFFAGSLIDVLNQLGIHNVSVPLIHIILPPGISFYTFEEVSYIVDVYKGRIKPATSYLNYALFISFFPHLIAGPIQKPGQLIPQVQNTRIFDPDRLFDGVMLIFSGLVRKCIIADQCALLANSAFGGQLGPPNFFIVLLGTYAFAWQVYGDFSGYSNIARGCAKLLGFELMVNFRQPFLAHQIQNFWRRWHISLSDWLRDYLYIPLCRRNRKQPHASRNLLITMLLAGLWHGANWTFVTFGAIHGAALALDRYFPAQPKAKDSAPKGPVTRFVALWRQRIVTFHIVCLSVIFFRAASVSAAIHFLFGLGAFTWRAEYLSAFVMLILFTVPLFLGDLWLEANNQEYLFATAPYPIRVGLAAGGLMALVLFSGTALNGFVYFQF